MERFGKYELLKKLAAGGLAEVFLARAGGPLGFEKIQVIKRIFPNLAAIPSFVEQFLSEAKLAAKLDHPNVVQVFDLGQQDGVYFIAMEYVDGPSLRVVCDTLRKTGSVLSPALCAQMVAQAAEGLAYAHDFRDPLNGQPLGILHRDVTPENILVSRAGMVKVADFGMAKAAAFDELPAHTLVGRLKYMAPEHLQRLEALDRRVDVYSLGVVLYELLTGATPYDSASEADITRTIISGKRVPATALRRDLPRELAEVLDRALGPRDQRYSTCLELKQDLERFIAQSTEPVGPKQVAVVMEAIGALGDSGPSLPSDLETTRVASSAELTHLTRQTLSGETSVDLVVTAADGLIPQVLRAPPMFPAAPLGVTHHTLTRNSLTQEVVDLRPAFPGEAYTQLQVRNPSLELTELEHPVYVQRSLPPAGMGASERARWQERDLETRRMPVPVEETERGWGVPLLVMFAVALLVVGAAMVLLQGTRATPRRPEARSGGTAGGAGLTSAPASPEATGPARVRIATKQPASVRVNGRLLGNAPVELKDLPSGELRVEVSNPDLAFRKVALLELSPGDNGTKVIELQRLTVELRIQPRARVNVDGADLGEVESTKVELYEGWHTLKAVDRKGRRLSENFIVLPDQANRFSYELR